MTGENWTCKYCSKEFDSKRGLHVHQGQIHPDEDKQEEPAESEENGRDSDQKGEETVQGSDNAFGDSENLELDKTEEDFSVNPGKDESPVNISLTTRQVAAATFTVGLLLGGIITGAYFMIDTTPNPYSKDAVNISEVNTAGEPVFGESDADVTMVMYEDFQCPYCRLHSQRTQPDIVSEYVDTGQLKLVWKDYPIPQLGHDWAVNASRTMECVYRQDNSAFWNLESKIYDNQDSISTDNVESKIISWAEQEGVNGTEVRSCLETGEPLEEVTGDKSEGANYNATIGGKSFVSGTPSFVIYGQEDQKASAVSGAVPFEVFDRLIKYEIEN